MLTTAPSPFNELPKIFVSFHKFLGIFPLYKASESGHLRISHLARITCLLVLIFYWIGVVFGLLQRNLPKNIVSNFSNYIQLLVNAVAFTAVQLNPLCRWRMFHEILELFTCIDNRLQQVSPILDHKNSKIINWVSLGLFTIFFMNHLFSFVATIWYLDVSFFYWLLTTIPLLTYAQSLHQSMLLIYGIRNRFQMAAKCWQTRIIPRSGVIDVLPGDFYDCGSRHTLSCVEKHTRDKKATVVDIIKDISHLCNLLEEYSGPVFCATFAALFPVTSIQTFYVITLVVDFQGSPIWTLLICINMIIVNLILVVGLCYTVEKALSSVDYILKIANLDQPTGGKEFEFLEPMLSKIKFSASGFFNINYNMLFGFVSALVTYLIILIQFHELAKGSPEKPVGIQPPLAVEKCSPECFKCVDALRRMG